MKVINFNKQKPPPDVQKEEWITCANPESMNPNEIGYKQLGDKVVDLLEKQVGRPFQFFRFRMERFLKYLNTSCN